MAIISLTVVRISIEDLQVTDIRDNTMEVVLDLDLVEGEVEIGRAF